jgi:predicted transglutaminase-like cysteine proteinase
VRRIWVLFALFGLNSPAGAAAGNVPLTSFNKPSPYMRVVGQSHPPYGFVQFCEAFAAECAAGPIEERRLVPTPERLSELDEVNRVVNHTIQPATDLELYGVSERWTLPVGRGDCEDYALLKRYILLRRGWPASALLMTVVRDEQGEGHAVLTARTAQGDFILDNKDEDVKLWHKTPYEFVMRQSYLNPKVWMALDVREASSTAQLAGLFVR